MIRSGTIVQIDLDQRTATLKDGKERVSFHFASGADSLKKKMIYAMSKNLLVLVTLSEPKSFEAQWINAIHQMTEILPPEEEG